MSRGRHDPITDETLLETLATHASDDGTDTERPVRPATVADTLDRHPRTVSDRLSALANRGEIERTWRQTEYGPKPAYLTLEDTDADDRELVTDGGTDETVYLAIKTSRSFYDRYHTDQDCRALEHARNVVAKPRSVIDDDTDVCKYCADEYEASGPDGSTLASTLLHADPGDVGDPLPTDQDQDPDLVTDGGVPSGVPPRSDRDDLYRRARDVWSTDAQLTKAAEEFAEAAAALNRFQNGQASRNEILAELVDAQLMLEQLQLEFRDAEYQMKFGNALDNLERRLEYATDTDDDREIRTDGMGLGEFGVDVPESDDHPPTDSHDTSEDYQYTRPQCRALTTDGDRCSNPVRRTDDTPEFCPRHYDTDCETIDDQLETDGGHCKDGTDRFEELEDEQYGYYNDVPHALIDLNYQEWSEVVKQVLEYTLGPPVAYYYEGGTLHLWGEQLDEPMLLEIADGCKDLEREFADDGFYDAAKTARRASSRVSRGVVHPAGEVTIT